ncbi:MAG TPA: MSHA biogenesis protein MshJ [Noviherbaspirillum sp.]
MMLFGVLAALLVVVANQFLLQTASTRITALSKQMITDKAAARKLQVQIDKLASTTVVDPDLENKARLAKLNAEEAAAQALVAALGKDLVAPDQMASMLESILARHGSLQLVSLVKLPIQSLSTSSGQAAQSAQSDRKDAGKTTASDVVYKHGVEIVLQGEYLQLMDYLAQLEKLPVRVVWGRMKLKVDSHPKSTMSLTMYTLSLEKTWINI